MKLKNPILTALTILCLLFTLLLMCYKVSVKASPNIIYVPTDYLTIQEAINHANSGDTILVYNGTYHEHVVLNKSVSLIGEDRDLTIIDGGGTGSVISVTANKVHINSFTIQNSGATYSDSGIYLSSSDNNISYNTITNNKNGIYLNSSSLNVVSGNNVTNNYDGIYLDSSSLNMVSNNIASSNDYGIRLYYASENEVSGNTVSSNNRHGIHLRFSSDNAVSSNNVSSNNYDGIYLDSSSLNMVSNNIASSNNYDGIRLDSSSLNVVSGNNVTNNYDGIRLYYASENEVCSNTASSNDYGIRLYYASENEVSGNTVSSNNYDGIYLDSSSNNNTIYHNNFINNVDQVWSDSMNVWDDNCEGNYWSDYTGQDLNGDGIGDNPYIMDVNNQDNHPLMGMFSGLNVVWKGKTYHATTICNSTISNFRFEVGRETGNKIISFDVAGEDGTAGFCRVMIPTELMNYPYIILVDREEIIPTLLDVSNETHVHLHLTYVHSSHTITIISSKLLYLYNELLDKHVELQTDFHNLNSTYYELLENYGALLGNYSQLLESYGTLNTSYQQHLLDYWELQGNHTSLIWEHTQNIQNLTYVFIATTAIFIIAAVYLSTHAHRRTSRN